MLYVKIDQVQNDLVMLIQDELTLLYYVAIESCQNYSFSPDFVSRPFKTKKAALRNFDVILHKYKNRLTID